MSATQRASIGSFAFAIYLVLVSGLAAAGTFRANNASESALMEYRVLAAQFLGMATFGPTSTEIEGLANRMRRIGVDAAKGEWIDRQFELPISEHLPLADVLIRDSGLSPNESRTSPARDQAWWHNIIVGPDQLRQRVGWALAQIWVIGGAPNGQFLGTAHYYDVLLRNSFGNYRDLMEDVTRHPIMGAYLSHYRNRKPDPALNRFPDENYARELLQLFTIGPLELQRNGEFKTTEDGETIPTYGNPEIEAFARVMTGFASGTAREFWDGPLDPFVPMQMFEHEHDPDSKDLLRGRTLPAGQDGIRDVKDALDNIFEHPNVGPFVARLLIQRLVMSNPPRAYVGRVARVFNGDDGGARGDMRSVIKAILLDPVASRGFSIRRTSELTFTVSSGATHLARLREPVVRYASLIRAFNPSSDCPGGRLILRNSSSFLGQGPYRSPSVFNFYLPDFSPGGTLKDFTHASIRDGVLVAPEFQLLTPTAVNRLSNSVTGNVRSETISTQTLDGRTCQVRMDFSREKQLAHSDPTELMRHLDLLLCQGTMSDRSRAVIEEEIVEGTNLGWLNQADRARLRSANAIIATMLLPECAIAP